MVHVILPVKVDDRASRHIALHASKLLLSRQVRATQRLRDKRKILLRFVDAHTSRKHTTAVLDQSCDNGVFRVGIVVEVRAGGAAALAPDNDTLRVATEDADVVADPLERGALVEEAHVDVCAVVGEEARVGEAENVVAVAGCKSVSHSLFK